MHNARSLPLTPRQAAARYSTCGDLQELSSVMHAGMCLTMSDMPCGRGGDEPSLQLYGPWVRAQATYLRMRAGEQAEHAPASISS